MTKKKEEIKVKSKLKVESVPLTIETLSQFVTAAQKIYQRTASGSAAVFIKKMHSEIIPMWQKINDK